VIGLLLALLPALAQASHEAEVVELSVTWTRWDSTQPWTLSSPSRRTAQAVVVDGAGHKPVLLTTAQMVEQATLVRASKHGDPGEVTARVLYVDREANLALVGVDDATFFDDLHMVHLAVKPATSGDVSVARWRDSQFETSPGRIARAMGLQSATGSSSYPGLRVQADISGGGWAEPVFQGASLVGLVSSASSDLQVMPASFVVPWLEEVRRTGAMRPWPVGMGAHFQ
jgi:hypothetical protein